LQELDELSIFYSKEPDKIKPNTNVISQNYNPDFLNDKINENDNSLSIN
jgi:hypothetical protein